MIRESGSVIYPGTGFQEKLKIGAGTNVLHDAGIFFATECPLCSMATARCCPADCALRTDWEDELAREKASLANPRVDELHRIIKLLAHPLRLRILLMLLSRDHCVCEFFHVFQEPQNLISYNLKKLRDGGLVESYYRSNHKIYRISDANAPAIKKIVAAVPE
jgi:DNA-binding transcriptional ArsR family regulator